MQGDQNTYTFYDIGETPEEIDSISMAAPTDEQKWWAYQVDEVTERLVVAKTSPDSIEFLVADPGEDLASIHQIDTEEIGEIGILTDFMVYEDRVFFVEGGRAWFYAGDEPPRFMNRDGGLIKSAFMDRSDLVFETCLRDSIDSKFPLVV